MCINIILLLNILVNSLIIKTEFQKKILYNVFMKAGGAKMSKNTEFKNRDRFIELGLTIAAIRKMKGMSQEKLAEKAHISRSHLSSIEAPNIVRPFSVEVLYNIADALDMRAGDLLNIKFPNG